MPRRFTNTINTMSLNDTSSKIDLCIKELLIIKDLLDAQVADDFCSRLLAIYAMVRVDDITKIWGRTIPKNDVLRTGYEAVLNSYNDNLRKVRDKLGAHYQCAEEGLLGSVELFKSIDYGNTICLLDQILDFQKLLTGAEIKCSSFQDLSDFINVKNVLEHCYSDDNATITNGALDLFGVNKGGLISCSAAQVKGQYLRSIELMVAVSYALTTKTYSDKGVTNLFKRMFVCLVYNFHDNLITRTDITPSSVQYEEGFDRLFLNLISNNDNREEMERAFSKFESLYQTQAFIKKNRKIRDHACAHLDEQSSVTQIDTELDSLDVKELHDVYVHLLDLFNYICNNVFLLKSIAIPNRSRIYDAFIESVPEIENYYGEKPNVTNVKEMDVNDVLRSIRKQDERCGEAISKLGHFLMSGDASVYDGITSAIAERLKEPKISDNELTLIISALYNAKRGFPSRLQHTVLKMMKDNIIANNYFVHLLWLLSNICNEDKEGNINNLLETIIAQKDPVMTGLATLAFLHKTVEKGKTCFVTKNKPHMVDNQFKNHCNSLSTIPGTCALVLMLAQRWFHDPEYGRFRSYETDYSSYFEKETADAIEKYFGYIKLSDEREKDVCKRYLNTRHYLLLLYRLALLEKERKQQFNVFLEFWQYNCFFRTMYDPYEALAIGLMTELLGQIEHARGIFASIVKRYPINECAIQTQKEFAKRHSQQ